jgi:hypothetical protein
MHIVKEIAGLLTFKMLMIRFSTERMIRGLSLSLIRGQPLYVILSYMAAIKAIKGAPT